MKTERRYIVVDEKCRPMTFQSTQFVYNYTIGPSRFKLRHYSKKEARDLIDRTIEYRCKKGFTVGEYDLMQISIQ